MSGLRIMGQMWDDNSVSFTAINIFFYCIQGSSRGGVEIYRIQTGIELSLYLREVLQYPENHLQGFLLLRFQ